MTELFICNLSHICNKRPCIHAQPHESVIGKHCGPAMPCNGMDTISWCVPINDGIYYEKRIITCKECNGAGHHELYISHKYIEKGETK